MFPVDKDENMEVEFKELWERICRQKIQEAYEEYMKQVDEYENNIFSFYCRQITFEVLV